MKFPKDYDEFGLIRDFGDILESHFAERIANKIPAYAGIWAEYIGNDGAAHALPMQGASNEALDARQEHWQCIYTLFESLAFCWDIEQQLTYTKAIEHPEGYIRYLNLWMAFYAHLGRIRDMVKDIALNGKLNRPDLLKHFEEYWKERHIVLHGPKVPLRCVNNVVGVPALGEGVRKWNDDMLWEKLGPADFKQISEVVTLIISEIEPKLNWFLAEMKKLLPDIYDWKPVNWSECLKVRTGWEKGMIAGSAGYVWPGGLPPPSGTR